jgi:hypothetical protein
MPFSDEGDDLGVRARILNLRQDAHPLHDLQGGIEKIYGMTTAPKPECFRPLHDGGSKPEPVEPVREHRTSHARTRDEHPSSGSRDVISLRIYG